MRINCISFLPGQLKDCTIYPNCFYSCDIVIYKKKYYIFGILKKDFTYLFLERGEGWEKERERNVNVCLPLAYPLLGTWPATQAGALDWELNWRPFGSQASTQSTEPHQPGIYIWSLSPFLAQSS